MAERAIPTARGPVASAPPRRRWWHASPAGLVVGTTFAAIGMLVGLAARAVRALARRSGALPLAGSAFATADDALNPDRPAPLEAVRSGSPQSLVDWYTLGADQLVRAGGLERSLELLHGGHTAAVAMQCSCLPSPLAPVVDRDRLLVHGESLGVVATQAASASLSDGLVVRFAQRPGDEDRPATPWLDPRVLYLQRASDPVVWSPSLLPSVRVAVAAPEGWDEADTARPRGVLER